MATNSGIVTDENSGERHIPESLRADGSTRKAIKIRPGYRPPEDVEVYKNRTAEAFRDRASKISIPGTAGLQTDERDSPANNKNAKRREARRKAAKAAAGGTADNASAEQGKADARAPRTEEADSQVERDKKARNLRKKLKQARDLQSKREGGETLLPEQIAKVIKINELVRELNAMGLDVDEVQAKAVSDEGRVKGTGIDTV